MSNGKVIKVSCDVVERKRKIDGLKTRASRITSKHRAYFGDGNTALECEDHHGTGVEYAHKVIAEIDAIMDVDAILRFDYEEVDRNLSEIERDKATQ